MANEDVVVPADVLARWLGVPPKQVYDLAKAGVLERGPGKLFDLEQSVQRYNDMQPHLHQSPLLTPV